MSGFAHLLGLTHGLAAALVSIAAFYLIGLLLLPRRWQTWLRWPDSIVRRSDPVRTSVLDRDELATYPGHLRRADFRRHPLGPDRDQVRGGCSRGWQPSTGIRRCESGLPRSASSMFLRTCSFGLRRAPPSSPLPPDGALDLVTYARYAKAVADVRHGECRFRDLRVPAQPGERISARVAFAVLPRRSVECRHAALLHGGGSVWHHHCSSRAVAVRPVLACRYGSRGDCGVRADVSVGPRQRIRSESCCPRPRCSTSSASWAEALPRVPSMLRFCSALRRRNAVVFQCAVSGRLARQHRTRLRRSRSPLLAVGLARFARRITRTAEAPECASFGCARGPTVRSLSCGPRQCGHFAGRHCSNGSAHLPIASSRALSSSMSQPASSSETSQCRLPRPPGRRAGQPDGAS